MNQSSKNNEIELIKDTIMANIKDIEINQIIKLGEGQRNRTYLVNQGLVFRFPINEEGVFDTQKETKILPQLVEQLTLAIPEFIFYGQQENAYPFVGYKLLPGKPLDEEQFSHFSFTTKQRIANQLGKFMTEMQAFNVQVAKDNGVRETNFYQFYSDILIEAQDKLFPYMDRDMQEYISVQFMSYLDNKTNFKYIPQLLHADLSLDHLLFDDQIHKLTGVIDFGDIQIGDPDYEYIYLLEECGLEFTIELMKDRRERDLPYKLQKLNFFLTADNVRLWLEGLKSNNRDMQEEAMALIHNEMTMRGS